MPLFRIHFTHVVATIPVTSFIDLSTETLHQASTLFVETYQKCFADCNVFAIEGLYEEEEE